MGKRILEGHLEPNPVDQFNPADHRESREKSHVATDLGNEMSKKLKLTFVNVRKKVSLPS